MRQPVRDRFVDSAALRRGRLAAGLSLTQAAEKSGVARLRIQRIETGLAQPTFSDVLDLCSACGCRIEKLLNAEGRLLLRRLTATEPTSLKDLIRRDGQARENLIDICWWYYRTRQCLNGLEIPALEQAGIDELLRHAAHAAAMDASVRSRLEEMRKRYGADE